jgi:hypothetical protein
VFAEFVNSSGTLSGLPATSTNHFSHDQLGSSSAISNALGAVTERLAYDPWGKRRYFNTTLGLPDTALSATKQRRAVPGNINGTVSAEAHNLDAHNVASSPFTSWTHDLSVALTIALKVRGEEGVLLRVQVGASPEGATWSWEWSPDVYGEQEVLMRGVSNGLEVFRS